MREKTHYSECPKAFSVERAGEHGAVIFLRENAAAVDREDGTQDWTADEYIMQMPWASWLEENVAENVSAWLARAKDIDYEMAAQAVREKRDELLSKSDKSMCIDRMGLTVPTGTTISSWLPFLKGIGETLNGEESAYRQALRDVPEQEGFPYDVIWPE